MCVYIYRADIRTLVAKQLTVNSVKLFVSSLDVLLLSRQKLGGSAANHERLSKDSRCPGRELIPAVPEYGVLPVRPSRSDRCLPSSPTAS